MTDRIKGFTVTLDKDVGEDNADKIRQAILSLKYVAAVNSSVVDSNDLINRQRVRMELGKKIIDIVFNEDEIS